MQPTPVAPDTAPPPTGTPNPPRRRRRHWLLILLGVFLVLFGLASGGFVVVTALEEQDTFCISCHLAPEITYFNRAYMALDNPAQPAPDLSTAHYLAAQKSKGPNFKCIDCHRGDAGLPHRIAAVALGAKDTAVFALGQYDQTTEKHRTKTGWLANASCLNCHSETLLELDGINNHFHSYLPAAREAANRGGQVVIGDALKAATQADPERADLSLRTIQVGLLCSDCHQPHKALVSGVTTFFMDTDLRNAACVECHVTAKEGPQDVRQLSGEDSAGGE